MQKPGPGACAPCLVPPRSLVVGMAPAQPWCLRALPCHPFRPHRHTPPPVVGVLAKPQPWCLHTLPHPSPATWGGGEGNVVNSLALVLAHPALQPTNHWGYGWEGRWGHAPPLPWCLRTLPCQPPVAGGKGEGVNNLARVLTHPALASPRCHWGRWHSLALVRAHPALPPPSHHHHHPAAGGEMSHT